MNESKLRRIRDRAAGAPTLINEGCRITGMITGNGDVQVSGEVAKASEFGFVHAA